jgi:hypothetical protein
MNENHTAGIIGAYPVPQGLTSRHIGAGAAETIPVQHINPLAHHLYAGAGAAQARVLPPLLPERSEAGRQPPPLGPWRVR